MSESVESLSGLLDRMIADSGEKEESAIEELLAPFAERAYGPLLLLPALLAVSPVGAIPGMSVVTGLLIVLIAGQAAWGRQQPWLPQRLLRFSVPRGKLKKGVSKMRPWALRIDRVLQHRFTYMAHPSVFRLGAVFCVVLAALFVPLAVVPMGVSIPGTAVVLFSLGWTARDGLVVMLAFVLSLAAGGMTGYVAVA
ncbi:MAG: exopolysaccharide biosynthesis protein [Myxococcota bacterium]